MTKEHEITLNLSKLTIIRSFIVAKSQEDIVEKQGQMLVGRQSLYHVSSNRNINNADINSEDTMSKLKCDISRAVTTYDIDIDIEKR